MKCKNCGGELLFQNGISVCQSCGATFSLDSVYENTEVYICYLENDTSGRRTKDSIIAQEVYNKLESAKITTFIERISADGLIGDDLVSARYAAINKAKAVIVLATSAENFDLIAEKYGADLEGKTVIPFCVDVNPGDIPKSLNKIQAISYTTIGWEKDLISGLYNLLGREKEINAKGIYDGARKKRKIIIGVCIAVVLAILATVAVIWFINKPDNSPAETESQELTAAETYEKAVAFMDEGNYCEALALLHQIPEHQNSAAVIKQIYSKYEGYYQNGDISMHLEILDNTQANIEVRFTQNGVLTRINVGANLEIDSVSYQYADNNNKNGKIGLKLNNSEIVLSVKPDSGAEGIDTTFALSEKSDQAILNFDKKTFFEWLDNKYSLSQIRALGYDVVKTTDLDRASSIILAKITDTDIILTFTAVEGADGIEDYSVCSISAPAKYIAPELVGKKSDPICKNDIIYWPNTYYTVSAYYSDEIFCSVDSPSEIVEDNTLIAVVTKKNISHNDYYVELWDIVYETFVCKIVNNEADKKYTLDSNWANIIAQNDTHALVTVSPTELSDDMRAWYKFDKTTNKATFIREGNYQLNKNYQFSEELWYSEYADFAEEFPNALD